MKRQKLIRYTVLFFGIGLMLILILHSSIAGFPQRGESIFEFTAFIAFSAIIGMLGILPHLIYVFITKKIHSWPRLLIPAILLCSFHLFFVIDYFTSGSSTTALIFIVLPIYGGYALASGFLLGSLVEKIRTGEWQEKMPENMTIGVKTLLGMGAILSVFS